MDETKIESIVVPTSQPIVQSPMSSFTQLDPLSALLLFPLMSIITLIQQQQIMIPGNFSKTPIGVPKYKYDINEQINGCKYWQYIPPLEQQVNPQFWSIVMNDKDTLEVNLNVTLACSKLGYDTMYLRFHNATIKNIPIGSQDIGCFWIYKDGQIMNNSAIPQYFAAPAYNPIDPDISWGSIICILFDGNNIKTGLTKYDLVYRGKNPFNPKSFELYIGNSGWNIC